MKNLYILGIVIFLILFIFSLPILGQNVNERGLESKKDSLLSEITDVDKKIQQYIIVDTIGGKAFRHMLDSLLIGLSGSDIYQLKRDKKGLLIMSGNEWEAFDTSVGFNDTVIFDPAFLPIVFDGRILPEDLTFLSPDTSFTSSEFELEYNLISKDSTLQIGLEKAKKINEQRRFYYVNHPQDVWVNAFAFDKSAEIKDNRIRKSSIFSELLSTDESVKIYTPTIETVTVKKSNWQSQGNHRLQVTQNQRSDNWSDGGNNFYSVLSHHIVNLDYKRKKISVKNTLEWKLDLKKEQGDEKHNVSLTEDYFKVYSVFALEAYKKWSYSSNLMVQTPLFPGYKVNSDKRWRSFLSPLDINLGVGLNYLLENTSKTDKYKKIKLSLDISPLSYNFRYIRDTAVVNNKETSYGIDPGRRSKKEFGSNVNMNLTYGINRYCTVSSRARYFTNYERVLFEFENKLDYELNRFFSVSMDLYIKFNDEVSRDKHDKTFGYFQYNETVRFGLNYRW